MASSPLTLTGAGGPPPLGRSASDRCSPLAERIADRGFEVSQAERRTLDGYVRFHCRDGFGNRVEVLCPEPERAGSPPPADRPG